MSNEVDSTKTDGFKTWKRNEQKKYQTKFVLQLTEKKNKRQLCMQNEYIRHFN